MASQLEKDIINSKIKDYVYKIEWLSPDEKVIGEVTPDIVGGNVNFDGTRSNRRSINLTFKNLDKKYIPRPNGKIWINQKFRFMAGYRYGNNQTLMYNQGVYCIGNPSVLSSPTQKEVTLQGLCKYSLLDGGLNGELKDRLIIPLNTRVDVAIKSLITEIGGETKYIIDECSELLPYTIEKEAGQTLSSIIEEIAYIVSYEAFYDNEGFFRFRKFLEVEDYQKTVPTWEYTTSGLYLESSREMLFTDVKNSITVVGDTLENGITISAIAKDNSNSDMSINAIGERFKLIEDRNITTIPLAQARANWELQQRIMLAETNKTNIIPNFFHTIGDIISLIDENNGSQGNYIIQSMDYDISYDSTMNLGLWKIRDWR